MSSAGSVVIKQLPEWRNQKIIVVIKCFYNAELFGENGAPVRLYCQQMCREWQERGIFSIIEKRLYDLVRAFRRNKWLSQDELEVITKRLWEHGEEAKQDHLD